MERLTNPDSRFPIDQNGGLCVTAKFISRLADYEDTGLEPEEILQMKSLCEKTYDSYRHRANITKDIPIDRLREKQEREENKPLTLEQLREMVDSDECGVHIWVLKTVSRSVVSALTDVTCPDGVVAIWNANATENFKEKDYGKTWLAYRHKPAKEDNDV